MTKPIAFIGIGQCGGNFSDIAEFNGFTTLAINSNLEDIESLKYVKNKIHLSGYSGAGKNRLRGESSLKDNLEDVIGRIIPIVENNEIDIINVAFSTDGGTGSGGGPLLAEILLDIFPNKIVNATAVLPEHGTIGAMANSNDCVERLSNIKELGACFFIDNQKVKSYFGNKSKDMIYAYTNNRFIELLDNLCAVIKYKSISGNFDRADLISVLSSRGASIIGKVSTLNDMSKINNFIENSWESDSIFSSPEYDHKIINAAFIHNTRDTDIAKNINRSQLFSNIGEPIEIFEGNYYNTNSQEIITILSGLTFPFKRLNEMSNIIEKNKPKAEESFRSSLEQRFSSKAGWVNDIRNNRQTQENKQEQSLSDRLKKFK